DHPKDSNIRTIAQIARRWIETSGSRLILLIDEFDQLFRHSWKHDVFDNMHALLNDSPLGLGGPLDGASDALAVCLAGGIDLQDLMVDETSPLASRMLWRHLTLLDADDLFALSTEPVDPSLVPRNASFAIFEATGGHPALAQSMLKRLVRRGTQVGVEDVEKSAREVGKERSTFFRSLWKKLPKESQEVFRNLAHGRSVSIGTLKKNAKLDTDGVLRAVEALRVSGIAGGSEENKEVHVANGLFMSWAKAYGLDIPISSRFEMMGKDSLRGRAWEAVGRVERDLRLLLDHLSGKSGKEVDEILERALKPSGFEKVVKRREDTVSTYRISAYRPSRAIVDYLTVMELREVLLSSSIWRQWAVTTSDRKDLGNKLLKINGIRRELAHFRDLPSAELEAAINLCGDICSWAPRVGLETESSS
ncbi:MAG: hypothetical protein KAI47_09125, partial [Deltaproteobacteria bacterium]|nr:hypothetical protein [Deltaproteobacteria bacterium]